jgi:hypothetical protein
MKKFDNKKKRKKKQKKNPTKYGINRRQDWRFWRDKQGKTKIECRDARFILGVAVF